MTISSDLQFKRLRELAGAFAKRQARAVGEASTPTKEDYAASATLAAVELAASTYAKRDGERRKKVREQRREVPAKRLPSAYRCTKVVTDKIEKTAAAVQFTCSVSDYSLEAAALAGDDTAKDTATAPAARADPKERCSRYTVWKAEYGRLRSDRAEGKVAEAFFDPYLASQLESFGTLEKLRRHIHAAGGETGKAREVIERKAITTFRALSREVHPDKLPSECAKEMEGMMREVFERGEALRNCITKPLRCKLPSPVPKERTCTNKS